MAGGEGSRLRPLTCTAPKPMLRLMGKPLLEYAIGLLRRHGVDRIAVTLGYLPDAVRDYFDDGADFGVELTYYAEKTPLGTAGGVKQAEDFLDEPFFVLSGDGVTDLDLAAALAFHREKRAQATLVLKRVENPLEYGVVVTDETGRVRGFYEKPGWGDVLTDAVNTGIYILEPELLARIPADRPCDFGAEVFPALIRDGVPVYGYVAEAYWGDVGDADAYLRTHFDALDGKIQLTPLLDLAERITVAPDARVDPAAVLTAPCLIGPGAEVCAGARVGPYAVLGESAFVGAEAGVKHGVVLAGGRLLAGAQARGCVLGPGAVMGEGARAFEGGVLGAGARLGRNAELRPGVRVWPEKRVPDGERQAANLVWGAPVAGLRAENGGILLRGPDHAVRAAQAYAGQLAPGEVLLGRMASAQAAGLWLACAAGLAAQGVQVVDAGVAPLPLLRHMQAAGHFRAAALVDDGALLPLNAHGAPLSRRRQRGVAALLARQDYAAPFSGPVQPPLRYGRGDLAYTGARAALFAEDARRAPDAAVFAPNNALLSLAERAFARAGLRARCEWEAELMSLAPGEIGVWLSESGESACLALPDPEGGEAADAGRFSEAETQLLRAWIALERGDRMIVERVSATRTLDALAERYGARVEYTAQERAVWLDRLAETLPLQFLLQTDGIALALLALSQLVRAGISLADWRAAMPETHRQSRTVDLAPEARGRVLQALARGEARAELGGGIRFPRENGWAWVCPDEVLGVCRVVSESPDAEFARELCDFYASRLRDLASPRNAEGEQGERN